MTCPLALIPAGEIEMQFAQFGSLADIIVTNEAIEIKRRWRARIGFDRTNLRQLTRNLGDGEQRSLGIFERGAARQVDHNGHFRLVVEWQELDGDALGHEQHADCQGRHADADKEQPSRFARPHNRRSKAPVDAAENAFAVRHLVLMNGASLGVQTQH